MRKARIWAPTYLLLVVPSNNYKAIQTIFFISKFLCAEEIGSDIVGLWIGHCGNL